MLINTDKSQVTDHVEFVSYNGSWPNLCSGLLVLKIDGVTVRFGNRDIYKTAEYPRFWESGGSCSLSELRTGEWQIDVDELPEKFRQYAAEIDRVFNDNVEYGCCGGCR